MLRPISRGPVRALCALACLALALGCGGGGGGAGGGDPGGDPDVLPLYRFAIGDTDHGEPFEVGFSEGGGNFTVALMFPGAGMGGTWDLQNSIYTIEDGSRVDVDSDVGDPLLGVFQIEVLSDIPVTWTGPPASGSYSVVEGVVTTVVTLNGSSVDVSVGGGPATNYLFDDFEDLMGSGASDDHQRVALAWNVLDYMLGMADFTTITFELVDDADLETTNPATGDCSSYGTLTPPPGVADPGSWSLLWMDVSGDGSVGPADDFVWSFDDCWESDPSDDDDDPLWQGGIQYLNLTRVVSGGFYTRLGYEPNGRDGGVFFNDTLQTGTEVSGGAVLLEQQRILNGSFKAVWWEP